MVPARQKRYVDRVENLPQLMTRIHAELGEEITCSKRKFKKGGFLGIGGVWMYEIIARSTADYSSHLHNFRARNTEYSEPEEQKEVEDISDNDLLHYQSDVIDDTSDVYDDIEYSSNPDVFEARLKSALPPNDNYKGDINSWPAAQRALKRKGISTNPIEDENTYDDEYNSILQAQISETPEINIIHGRDIHFEDYDKDKDNISFKDVLKTIDEIAPENNELLQAPEKESTFEEETQASTLKFKIQEIKSEKPTEFDSQRISPLKTRVTRKIEAPDTSKSKSVWPFNPDLELPDSDNDETNKPKIIKVDPALIESIKQIQEDAKGEAAKYVEPDIVVPKESSTDPSRMMSAEDIEKAIFSKPSDQMYNTYVETEKVEDKLSDIMRFLKDIQRQVNSISEQKETSPTLSNETSKIVNRPEISGSILSDPIQQSAINEVMEWDISPTDATELVQRAMSNGPEMTNTVEMLLKKVKRVIYGDVIITEGIKSPETSTGKVVVVIGATGVGKTTTIAKIAAGFLLGGKHRVALVSIDTYRIAAAEQLKTYAEIMGLSLDVVFNKSEFDQVLTERRRDHLVLVDTAGRSPLNREQMDQLRDFLASHPPDEIHLVVDAATKRSDLKAYLERFNRIGFDALILSKLDETGSLGTLFNISRLTRKPISYFTFGQSVPQDISPATLSFIRSWVESGDKR